MSVRLEQHLNDVSVALDGIGFTLGAIATVLRFYVESQGGQDPLQGTVYEGLGFTDGEDDGPPSAEFPD